MPDQDTSQLPAVATPLGTDLLYCQQGGADKGMTVDQAQAPNQVFNVRHAVYGAVGNGQTESPAGIQAAIDAAEAAGGGTVLFPQTGNSYKISGGLTVEGPNIAFRGEGGLVTIEASGTGYHIVTLSDAADDFTSVDIYFKGNNVAGNQKYGILVAANAAPARGRVVRCRFTGTNNGIGLTDGTDWIIARNHFEGLVGTASGDGYGVLSPDASARNQVIHNIFIGAAGEGRHAVYFSVGATDCVAAHNTIKNFNFEGIVCGASSAQAGLFRNLIYDNSVFGGGTVGTAESGGILVRGKSEDCVVSANLVQNFDNCGIIVDHGGQGQLNKRTIVSGNVVELCSLIGIQVIGAQDCTTIGNTVSNNSQDSPGSHAGIQVGNSGSGGTYVANGCRVEANVVHGSDHSYAFVIDNTGSDPVGTHLGKNILRTGSDKG